MPYIYIDCPPVCEPCGQTQASCVCGEIDIIAKLVSAEEKVDYLTQYVSYIVSTKNEQEMRNNARYLVDCLDATKGVWDKEVVKTVVPGLATALRQTSASVDVEMLLARFDNLCR